MKLAYSKLQNETAVRQLKADIQSTLAGRSWGEGERRGRRDVLAIEHGLHPTPPDTISSIPYPPPSV